MNDPASETGEDDPARFQVADESDQRASTANTIDSEGSYTCDSCGEEIVIPLDPFGGHSQNYVEDCPVCCHPNIIHVDWDDNEARVWAEPEQDHY